VSSIHFIGGEKGGVGKSVLARLLAQYHIDRGLPFRGFDTDRSHGALLRFYAEYAEPAALDGSADADRFVEAALKQPQDILVDLAAQTAQPLSEWMDDNDLLGLAAEQGFGLRLWHVLDDGRDSTDLLGRLFERHASGADYVVVRNLGRGSDFAAFEESSVRAAAATLGAPVMDLPALHASTMRKVDQLSLSFWAAGNNPSAGLGLMERQRVKVWLRRAYAQLDALGEGVFCAPVTEETTEEVGAEP
jgi:hypothetical protein